MKAFLISCNGSVRAISLNKKKAEDELLERKMEHWKKHKHLSLDDYDAVYCWYAKEFDIVK